MAMQDPSSAQVDQRVKHLEQQLIQAQKLTALGTLVGTTTHEFNNVLMTIINYAKSGLRHADSDAQRKAFDKILAAGQRAAKITNGILSYARNRSGGYEPTDLKQIVEDTLLLLDRELHKYRVHCELKLAPVPSVIANGNQIQQILMNLMINARQAMPDGGRMAVSLRHDPDSGMVELGVRDTGCGMSAEVMHRIFDAFFTTKSGADDSGKGGTGLGLATCRQIVEAHQGKIRVESTPGKGTMFTIRLPSAAASSSLSSSAVAEGVPGIAVPPPSPLARQEILAATNHSLPRQSLPPAPTP